MDEPHFKKRIVQLNRKQAAHWLTQNGCPISTRTLDRLAAINKGPPFTRFGARSIRYDQAKLAQWSKAFILTGGEDL
jgi:hypothetical protein